MSANPAKQNLRYNKTDRAWRKKSYKGLTDDQKRMVKLTERHKQLEKDLNYFWQTAPRNINGAVDWGNCTKEQLDYFEYINKDKERTFKSILRMEEKGITQEDSMKIFIQLNTKSVCF